MSFGWFNPRFRYKVNFDFVNDFGELVHTDLDNNGAGYCLREALDIQHELNYQGNRNVSVEQIKENK